MTFIFYFCTYYRVFMPSHNYELASSKQYIITSYNIYRYYMYIYMQKSSVFVTFFITLNANSELQCLIFQQVTKHPVFHEKPFVMILMRASHSLVSNQLIMMIQPALPCCAVIWVRQKVPPASIRYSCRTHGRLTGQSKHDA